jgi:predicted AlkP superfamily pyrophosphatase or phosphodiesterase
LWKGGEIEDRSSLVLVVVDGLRFKNFRKISFHIAFGFELQRGLEGRLTIDAG